MQSRILGNAILVSFVHAIIVEECAAYRSSAALVVSWRGLKSASLASHECQYLVLRSMASAIFCFEQEKDGNDATRSGIEALRSLVPVQNSNMHAPGGQSLGVVAVCLALRTGHNRFG
ncbi:hypothetical protein DPSP01_010477 [Paraphaeosphaeria sporulosa]